MRVSYRDGALDIQKQVADLLSKPYNEHETRKEFMLSLSPQSYRLEEFLILEEIKQEISKPFDKPIGTFNIDELQSAANIAAFFGMLNHINSEYKLSNPGILEAINDLMQTTFHDIREQYQARLEIGEICHTQYENSVKFLELSDEKASELLCRLRQSNLALRLYDQALMESELDGIEEYHNDPTTLFDIRPEDLKQLDTANQSPKIIDFCDERAVLLHCLLTHKEDFDSASGRPSYSYYNLYKN